MAGAEQLLLKWAEDLCGALAVLHEHGLAHGDVSPGNIIVQGDYVTLIDYDLLTRSGEIAEGQGTPPYSAPAFRRVEAITLADDLYALGAALFHALFDRDPFLFDGIRIEGHGLAWQDGERESVPRLAEFLERSVALEPAQRFADSRTALNFLRVPAEVWSSLPVPAALQPNLVPRLKEILRSYTGSRYGNAETRGLDSAFAHDT
jgi:serine/threonine protein kinase